MPKEPTPLGELLYQLGTASARNTRPQSVASGRYAVSVLEFTFSPFTRALSGRRAQFAVDQTLAPAFLQRGEIGPVQAAPGAVAIRLKSLKVHDNRALWGRTDIRVDALVVTGAASQEGVYTPMSWPFPRIGDDDSLPFNDLLVYQGAPARYIDFAIWVSKEKPEAKPLSELLKETLNDAEFKVAATTLMGLALAASAAGTLVGAATAAGTVIYFADRFLKVALGSAIGLYRTSFLSPQFGLGRHPQTGAIRAQDFSLTFEVVRVEGT
jgi:hypothetical protein